MHGSLLSGRFQDFFKVRKIVFLSAFSRIADEKHHKFIQRAIVRIAKMMSILYYFIARKAFGKAIRSMEGISAMQTQAVPAGLSTTEFPTVPLFGLDICAVRFDEAADALFAYASAGARPARVIVTPNVDHLVRLQDASAEFTEPYRGADYIFADGMPVVWASRLLGRPLPERVTGADLFLALAQKAGQAGMPVTVIGGMPGQEEMLREAFARVYPGMPLELFCPSMQFDPLGAEGIEARNRVNRQRPGIVFICLGMPKQERWAFAWQQQLDASLVLCVGAAMDFALGFKRRAPRWMQKAGLEWFWRLASEPHRLWRRYIMRGSRFVGLLARELRKNSKGKAGR
jgi:N-acetylglucosaminyldiphosphoundecaprenol N-acetyl-beta-D-mannosaminyltransferase